MTYRAIEDVMFSGIVETTSVVNRVVDHEDVVEVTIARPPSYDDISTGDSIAVNGVCLTVERLEPTALSFTVGRETLRVTGWPKGLSSVVNLERSLKFGERVHGHIVQGHVDGMAKVLEVTQAETTLGLQLGLPHSVLPLVWKKGSITINGVSLTINEIKASTLSVWLIPETLKRTNLGSLNVGNFVTIEVDMMARFLARQKELSLESH